METIKSKSEYIEVALLLLCLLILLFLIVSWIEHSLTGNTYLVTYIDILCSNPSGENYANAVQLQLSR